MSHDRPGERIVEQHRLPRERHRALERVGDEHRVDQLVRVVGGDQ
jgi:hypothetical protein